MVCFDYYSADRTEGFSDRQTTFFFRNDCSTILNLQGGKNGSRSELRDNFRV